MFRWNCYRMSDLCLLLLEQWRRCWALVLVEKFCRCVYYFQWDTHTVSMSMPNKAKKKNCAILLLWCENLGECFRQSNSTSGSESSSGQALHSDLHRLERSRWICEAGALAGCPESDPAELPAGQQRQREWTAARRAVLLVEGHLSDHHPQGGLPRWRLLHLHLWTASFWFKAGTDMSHCWRWVKLFIINNLISIKL